MQNCTELVQARWLAFPYIRNCRQLVTLEVLDGAVVPLDKKMKIKHISSVFQQLVSVRVTYAASIDSKVIKPWKKE